MFSFFFSKNRQRKILESMEREKEKLQVERPERNFFSRDAENIGRGRASIFLL